MYNFWTLLLIILFFTTTCYCGKKEFFDEPGDENTQVNKGTSYSIHDVDKATKSIIKHFGETENVNISITKIVSIKNKPGVMKLHLFLYNPIKNTILGYIIDVNMPIKKNGSASIKDIQQFTNEEEIVEYTKFNPYTSIDFEEGKFT